MTKNPLEQQHTLGSPLAHQLSDKVGGLELGQRRSSHIRSQLKHQAAHQGVLRKKQYMGSGITNAYATGVLGATDGVHRGSQYQQHLQHHAALQTANAQFRS